MNRCVFHLGQFCDDAEFVYLPGGFRYSKTLGPNPGLAKKKKKREREGQKAALVEGEQDCGPDGEVGERTRVLANLDEGGSEYFGAALEV